jgi:hypothetical protein
MARLTVDTARATVRSAAEISQLLQANSIARGGELYGDWSEQVITSWLNDGMQAFVARVDNTIKGVLLTSEPHYLKSVPVIRMLEHVEQAVEFYVYGPVCIAGDVRGAGLLAKLWRPRSLSMASAQPCCSSIKTTVPRLPLMPGSA